MKKVYLIHVSEPPSDHNFEGRDFYDISKGGFTSKEVAEGVRDFMRMFQEVGDESRFTVRELELHEEATLEEWMAAKGPGVRRTG